VSKFVLSPLDFFSSTDTSDEKSSNNRPSSFAAHRAYRPACRPPLFFFITLSGKVRGPSQIGSLFSGKIKSIGQSSLLSRFFFFSSQVLRREIAKDRTSILPPRRAQSCACRAPSFLFPNFPLHRAHEEWREHRPDRIGPRECRRTLRPPLPCPFPPFTSLRDEALGDLRRRILPFLPQNAVGGEGAASLPLFCFLDCTITWPHCGSSAPSGCFD